MKVRTRFAPSPTGSMHIGNLRTAFYAYALAKHLNGDFILRIEDTDKKREKEGGVEDIKRLLGIFNIKWDEFYVQSERLGLYKKAAERLVKEGSAFYCQCEAKNAKEDGFSKDLRDPCRYKNLTSGAIKLRVPDNEGISFTDFVINKKVSWSTNIVGDATLLKTDKFPTYHLAVVVDDHDMKISHVLRGHDWTPSTPIHLLVYKYLGYEVPEIGHLTDIMDPDGGKLSKRKGSTSVQGLLNEGYLPEALFNFVILLGWAPKNNQELFNLNSFVKDFDQKGFQKSNPVFNREKLDWFNGDYIRKLSTEELIQKLNLENTAKNKSIVGLIQGRIKKLSDFNSLANFFFEKPELDKKLFGENYKLHLEKAIEGIEKERDLMEVVKENNFKTGDFFMDLRIAITGAKFTPPINESIAILGKEEALKRLCTILEPN
ncbi:glutamate--tRNA ligase [Candidatus Woesebacteria bacterium GWC2_33_12]|uniref:Glutamate--tRNA ligase n=1 Tax=Candidatus Woesebacteria bacterium GW2011_GWB1_33_22 TaxID=1618566 RepID=A0A0G0CKF5_9BACT|nr:MAG: Glutamate-tRNA ligase [Candidatus Woesebacteria bacterium GW2011_GWC2_33_12]KKP41509.1 MAG: Glutamate-tRNA ligase [Candidatus Woesebacteria bacterium GW2011_GWA2_33_20]KKP43932.1 MAG: Glutamate-tRNA ligase [Candidatus Woesebacteria bacterium GW2011_GWB1_33_22]KKP45655.1 MAG: Glutamate-tRNA ligase [Microgenomates group bacterium GW2011_GWC1_33_28]KKP49436.1 MAG: Glutamate-tRNA ligase [Candidatus Woesebacteria bacterium GW2011_GWA1_33_33]OGM06742.1 MAG: glutamate--tRNA ligase [Candidatus